MLPVDFFRNKSPASIISVVGTLTLAQISGWTEKELLRVGWLDNPIISLIYHLNVNTGIWVSRADTDASESQAILDAIKISTDGVATAVGLSTDELVKLTAIINIDRLQVELPP